MKTKFFILCTGILVAGCFLWGCDTEVEKDAVEKYVYVNQSSLTVFFGDTAQLKANPAGDAFEWTSADPAIATVTSGGLVEAVGVGRTEIAVTQTGASLTKIPVSVILPTVDEAIVAADGNGQCQIIVRTLSERITTARVIWNNGSDSTDIAIDNRIGFFMETVNYSGDNGYVFRVVSFDRFGNRSPEIEASPLRNREISARAMDDGSLTIQWGNNTQYVDHCMLSYINQDGVRVSEQVPSSVTSSAFTDYLSDFSYTTLFVLPSSTDLISIETVTSALEESRPFKGLPVFSAAAPCIIDARDFDFGGEGLAFHDSNTSNDPNGSYRANNGDPAGAAADVEGGGNIGYTSGGEWVVYTVEVQDAGMYFADMRLSVNGDGGKGFSISVDGVKSEAILLPNNNDWSNWRWVFESGLYSEEIMAKQPKFNLSAGKHKVRITYESDGFNWISFKFIKEGSVTVSPNETRLAPGDKRTLTANVVGGGGNVSWSSSNPSVATVDASTGEVTAVDYGTADIIATSAAGATGKCVVIVEGFPAPVGVWTFSDSNDPTKADIGLPLESVGGGFIPADGHLTVQKGSYGKALHGIAANGGGSRVNEYTLLIDFRIPSTGQWYALFQTNLNNDGDASCFIHPNNRNIGIGSTGYYGSVDAGVWYRFIVAAKLGTSYNYYLDGTRLNSKTDVGIDNNSFSLSPDGVLLFADNDGEDADIDVSTVKIWNRQLTDEQVSTLGTAE